jgi:hypothetical protein
MDMAASAVTTTAALRKFADTWRAAESQVIATHPDLTELNVQLDGFYD